MNTAIKIILVLAAVGGLGAFGVKMYVVVAGARESFIEWRQRLPKIERRLKQLEDRQ